jgi:hypothetical protein
MRSRNGTSLCSRCGHTDKLVISAAPIFEQVRDVVCPACGARGLSLIQLGDRSYGSSDAFAAIEIRLGKAGVPS